MKEQLGRRAFLRRGAELAVTTAAGSLVAVTPDTMRADNQQSWADTFKYAKGGIPERATSPDGKFGPHEVTIAQGETAIMVVSQMRYDSNDPMTGEQLFIKGREDHPVVVVINSDPNKDHTVRTFTDMPVGGGWMGVVANPDGAASLTEEQLYEAISVRITALRNPALNNCAPGVGCTGSIEYIAIGALGDVTDHGARYR